VNDAQSKAQNLIKEAEQLLQNASTAKSGARKA
jgi:hypothetical protein